MDLHRCFKTGIMSLVDVSVSSSNMGVYDTVLFLKCFKKLLCSWDIRFQVGTIA